MDEVFKAIVDPSRRLLLDSLREEDGQTLGTLVARLPHMTRYGVMSHLRVLEGAGLITTRRQGRFKLHYLNPLPIRLIHDRWITRFASSPVSRLAVIKQSAEGAVSMQPDHVYQAYIGAPRERVWQALIDGDDTVQYFYGTRVESDWEVGSKVQYLGSDGTPLAEGEVLAFDPPSRLEMTFTALWDPELAEEGPVREVWIVGEQDGITTLTVELYDAPAGSKRNTDFVNGFPYIFSALKTLLETGKPLGAPGM